MLAPSWLLRRRRGSGHVVKFLEGVPTPTKLIDHLAGADLHAAADLPFYNTVPRYVDVQREQRLSKLFFHHVLYPAGGARLPYQAVVVRGGRAVRSSTPRLLHQNSGASKGHKMEEAKTSAAAATTVPSASPRARPNPLAVPASQLGSSATALMEEVPSSATWARADPARRPYFTANLPGNAATGRLNRYRNTHADSGPAATNPYLSDAMKHARHDATSSTRAVEDEMLKPLRGLVEHDWNSEDTMAAITGDGGGGENEGEKSDVMARLERLLVAPNGGLLWLSSSGGSGDAACGASVWQRLVTWIRQHPPTTAAAAEPTATPASWTTFAYVQTHLPPAAAVLLPVEQSTAAAPASPLLPGEGGGVMQCRMAGGVEPVVPFAVGRPLMASSTSLFSHITCLTRLELRVAPLPVPPVAEKAEAVRGSACAASQTRSPAAAVAASFASSSSSSSEPWKLGPDGLDLMVPQHVRTVAELHPGKAPPASPRTAKSADGSSSDDDGRYVVGRSDAETYLLPQRELLLTLHVPAHTADMCVAQNNDRLQRQVRVGRAGGAVAAWPTEHTRTTSARRALGRHANAVAAGGTDAAPPSSSSSATGGSGSSETGEGRCVSRTCHEVRALPGDVVYIPRGWGYDVQRILGTATVHNGQHVAKDGAPRHDFRDHRALSGRRGSLTPPPVVALSGKTAAAQDTAAAPCTVEAVAVDAFCLHYKPYPELTAAQADVYVAANYVHAGVEEFYEKGGNDVFRSYSIKVEPYGYDKMVWLETDQIKVGVTNYAASVASVQVYHPTDKKWIEVNCGYPKNPEEAYADPDYMGATVGRSAGRVAGGVFELDGTKYYTQKNRGENTCHCGDDAYHKKHWGIELIETKNVIGVTFNYTSPHMESGFPAEVKNYCTFSIERSKPNALKTVYHAHITDHSPADASPINVFSHTSFNLNGIPGQQEGQPNWVQPESVRNHWVRVPASYVAEADRASIPTGEFLPVEGTIFDFREGRVIGDTIDDVAVLDRDPCGYDHPLAIDGWEKGKLMFHGEAKSPITKIHMKVYSTFPCMWVYSANNKPLPASGGPGQRYARWTGLLVGPQNFSDCSNYYAKYPNCIVRRGEEQYSETTINEFIVE